MRNAKDVTGLKFNRLTAMRRCTLEESPTQHRICWLFRCECGVEGIKRLTCVTSGAIKSCGCLRKENPHTRTHGKSKSGAYESWSHAKARCFCKTNKAYSNYGGRGITMCREWASSFSTFLRDMGERPPSLTLDRRDVNGNYQPDNCRWLKLGNQSSNRRNIVWVSIRGRRLPLMTACRLKKSSLPDSQAENKERDVSRGRISVP